MSKPFDATLNRLIDACPDDWAAFLAAKLGLSPGGPVTVVDTDLSVTTQADKVFRLPGPPPALIHLEMESTSSLGMPGRLLRYNVLLGHIRKEPIHSVVLLLRPEANASDLTGVYTRSGADGQTYHEFRYRVVRLWEEPIAPLLAGGPGTAPLALLTNEATTDLPGAVTRFRDRLREADVDRKLADELLGSAFVLSGLRYDSNLITDLYRSLSMTLEDSTTYQWILNKGLAQGMAQGVVQGAFEELRRVLQMQGRKRFGDILPSADTELQGITDKARLERMAERILDATDWNDLLATP